MHRKMSYLTFAVVIVLVSGCTAEGAWDMIRAAGDSPEWEGPEWNGTVEITIDTSSVDGYLFDVPVPVRVNTDRIRYDLVNAEGTDIAFYDSPYEPGSTPLDHELSLWNPEGESVFWVRLPVVNGRSSTTVYLHAGSETVAVEERPEEVWRNGYVAVLHFDDPDDPWKDSTRFANNAEADPTGHTTPAPIAGVIGGGVTADEPTDAVVIPNSPTTDTMTRFTWGAWLRVDSGTSTRRVFSKGSRYLSVRETASELSFQSRLNHESDPPLPDPGFDDDVFGEWTSAAITDEWFHLALSWTGAATPSSLDLRIDGNPASKFNGGPGASYQNGEPVPDTSFGFTIANYAYADATAALPGIVDEVRLAAVERSGAWLRFQRDLMDESIVSYGPFIEN